MGQVIKVTALTSLQNNNNSAAWVLSQALDNPSPMPEVFNEVQPLSAVDVPYDHNMEAKVNQILASTAHHLAAGLGKLGLFPHRFVSRGRERKRPGFNMLSLPEHIWGIFMIMKQCQPQNDIKLYLCNISRLD